MESTGNFSSEQFAALAKGDLDVAAVLELKKTIRREVEDKLGLIAASDIAFDYKNWSTGANLLRQLDRAEREAIYDQPYVNVWATECLAAIERDINSEATKRQIQQIGSIAVSALIRSNKKIESATLPIHKNHIVLPGLGKVLFSQSNTGEAEISFDPDKGIRLSTASEQIFLPKNDLSSSKRQWQAMRHLKSPLSDIEFDDISFAGLAMPDGPLNDLLSQAVWEASTRVNDVDFDNWRAQFSDALSAIIRHTPQYAPGVAEATSTIIPIKEYSPGHRMSRSLTFGSVALTPPRNTIGMAAPLIEELHRSSFEVVNMAEPLHERSDNEPLFYAPWYDFPVSTHGLISGLYSKRATLDILATMADSREEKITANVEIYRQMAYALSLVKKIKVFPNVTSAGRKFAEGLDEYYQTYQLSALNDEDLKITRQYELDHALSWRLRNLYPDHELLSELGRVWWNKRDCPEITPKTQTIIGVREIWGHYRRLKLGVKYIVQGYSDSTPGKPDADIEFAKGNTKKANDIYRHKILKNPDDAEAWAGFALSNLDAHASQILWHMPELVCALHKEVFTKYGVIEDPQDLARWLYPTKKSNIIKN